ncbi:diguanylate cyclase [Oceanirhabdus seepicola]|uniref:Diguanylate cyclase n=1 Tax=Oceanirhabdus seepicola TaxID=2828781 RepID=A0A9J6NYW5_9CLOT|nr:diguanylate cyclase [Oceanirhabdus seepicola]MCM1988336.1 diguanylate cyclase [Oceanirhabdus seepicola]
MKKIKRYWVILFALIFIILISDFNKKIDIDIKANKGVLNLSDCDFNENVDVKLQGEWNLYYGELLMPENIKKMTTNNYYNIPGRLREQVDGKTQGYMTLHLKIVVPKEQIYGICFDSLFSSSDIWVNGIYLDGHGKVGKDIKNEKAIYRPQYIFFSSINKEADIVIHTSTFRDLEPSLSACTFGTKQQIMELLYKNVCMDGFIIGIAFIMGILTFGFYFTEPKQKRNLYFAIICFMMILRCVVFNSRILVQIYPNMHYEILSKIAAITFYGCVTFYILFLDDMFENRIKIKNMAIVFGVGFTLLCVATDNVVYDGVGIYAQVIVGFFALYLCMFMGKEIYRKKINAQRNLFLFSIIFVTGLNDILVNNSVLHNPYSVQYGFIAYIVAQSIFIVNDYLEKHRKLEKIHRDGLTSLYNNKYIKELLLKHLANYSENNEKFSVIMIDIDDFKGINDTFGHMFGDTVIMDVASILEETTEDKGYAGRFGGDEFIIILPKTIEKDALIVAGNIMEKIEKLNDKYQGNKEISISIGVYENVVKDLTQCINDVDSSLYRAKASGKNCINSANL